MDFIHRCRCAAIGKPFDAVPDESNSGTPITRIICTVLCITIAQADKKAFEASLQFVEAQICDQLIQAIFIQLQFD